MEQTVMEPPVAKKKMGRPKSDRSDVTVKMDKALASRAKAIAHDRGVPVAEIVTEAARATIDRWFGEVVRKIPPPER